MNLMEYQGKELFRRVGIPVPQSRHALTPREVAEFLEHVVGEWVVKAQVLMGGRGKAGKIKFAKNSTEGRSVAELPHGQASEAAVMAAMAHGEAHIGEQELV